MANSHTGTRTGTSSKKKAVRTVKNRCRYGYRVLGKGVLVSNDTRTTHLNNNDLICGASGSSKTGSVVYTQLKTLEDSSLVVVDTKGRLCSMFTRELRNKGYDVLTLDFANPERSCKYNPLSYIRKNSLGTYNELDISKLAASLMPLGKYDREPFWTQSARLLLESFISYTLEALPEEDHTMYSVSRLYRAFTKEKGETGFLPWLDDHPHSFAKIRYDEICALKSSERTLASVYGFVNTALFPFDISEMRNIFEPGLRVPGSRPKTLDIGTLGEKKTVLFLNVSDVDHSMDALINIFYTQVLQTLISKADQEPGGQLKIPVRVIMDDFASSATIPDFDKIISVVRSRDLWLTLCIQSFTQLESLYTYEQAQTIVSNCDHIVFLGSNDLRSAQFIGTRANRTPESILVMDRSKEYVLEGGRPAVMADKVPPYSYADDDIA
ncbi:MAG: type IV secretory system conjugative DNA transfer family protein [Lachnospiraceae bacterium]|nr:type IV secretory system conjugative DNA transfer family protein [Lachnospiraceae bacterium]